MECLSKALKEKGERFYYKRVFVSLEDLKEKVKRWLVEHLREKCNINVI